MMAFVEIAPRYREALHRRGLFSARDFLLWPGVILSGHPNRHVLRVQLGDESFVLKKEHRVPWRNRLASAWAGFGWSSKSVREASMLGRLRDAGIPCPEVVAAGEDGRQAFLLLREQADMTDLRTFLSPGDAGRSRVPSGPLDTPGPVRQTGPTREPRDLAVALGRELACIHAAGFEQPDLYAKHILVRSSADGYRFCFLDWQRSRHRRAVTWQRRLRDLAALDASLAVNLASDRLRLVCLCAYWRGVAALSCASEVQQCFTPTTAAAAIRSLSARLLRRRKVRELRQPPVPDGAQHLLWLEPGERLCIARDFHAELGGRLPSWLPQGTPPRQPGPSVEHRLILLGTSRTVHLVKRWQTVATWLPRRKFPAPEFVHAAAIFRLQRFGVAGPRLLAMGHCAVTAMQRFSFLLTEPPPGEPLATVLRQSSSPRFREALLHHLDALLAKIREAGYTFRTGADIHQAWVVAGVPVGDAPITSDTFSLALASVELLTTCAANPQAGRAERRIAS